MRALVRAALAADADADQFAVGGSFEKKKVLSALLNFLTEFLVNLLAHLLANIDLSGMFLWMFGLAVLAGCVEFLS